MSPCPYLEVCVSKVVVSPLVNAVHRHLLVKSFPATLPWHSQLAPRGLVVQKLSLRTFFKITFIFENKRGACPYKDCRHNAKMLSGHCYTANIFWVASRYVLLYAFGLLFSFFLASTTNYFTNNCTSDLENRLGLVITSLLA